MNEKLNHESNLQENTPPETENPSEIELSPEIVKEIENLEMIDQNKVLLIVTASGLKPASIFATGIGLEIDSPKIENITSVIKKLNLKFEVKKRKFRIEKEKSYIEIIVANNLNNLKFLSEAARGDSDELLGRACGLPKTAIEAYIGKREALDREKLPDEIKKSDAVRFCFFKLSADNWPEEIKQGQKYADLVKRISPKIYQEVVMYEETLE